MNTTAFRRLGLALLGTVALTAQAAEEPCSSLAAIALPATQITSAVLVSAGSFTPPATPAPANPTPQAARQAQERAALLRDLPAFCRVIARVTTSPSSSITVETWLPASNWNGKFLVNGYAFFGNKLNPVPLATVLKQGYATATTDNGLPESATIFDGSFLRGQPERLTDWGERAWHETVVKSKALITAYYGKPATKSYFNGAGGAGRQGLMAIQRYPDDFDGVVVGGIAADPSHFALANLWAWLVVQQQAGGSFPDAKLSLLHRAAVGACDADDGVRDGLISDPERCGFDPASLQCKLGDEPGCLNAGQVAAARQLYAPITHARTGRRLFGPLMRGGELGWTGVTGPQPAAYALEFFRSVVFQDPDWDPRSLNLDSDVERAEAVPAGVNAVDPDLSRYFASGGKLLMYGGWGDTAINPGAETDYYRSVVERLGETKANQSLRLYMLPMMGHFLGGTADYAYQLTTQDLMESWVERGHTPQALTASLRLSASAPAPRDVLLCPYPRIAFYKGKAGASRSLATREFACRVSR
jgi:feruloyl esterase